MSLTIETTEPSAPAETETLDFITADDVSRLTRLPAETVKKLANRGQLTAYKLGPRTTRFLRPDVMQWIERSRRPASVGAAH